MSLCTVIIVFMIIIKKLRLHPTENTENVNTGHTHAHKHARDYAHTHAHTH